MSKKEGYSVEGLFGTIKHYDSKGHKIGESVPSMWGGYNNYDSKGHKIGETRPSFLGYNTYDNKGHKTGSSMQGFLGTNHYDAKGHKVGTTMPSFLGSNTYGNGSASPDVVNQASAAAAMQHDAAAMAIGVIATQNSINAASEPTHESYGSSAHASAVRPSVQAKAETLRYVIVRVPGESRNRYYQVYDDVSVGDHVVVSDYDSPVQVLAAVECDAAAAPCSPQTMQRVLYVKK